MKKISLLILMLTFLLIPTCVNANGVSWEDFITTMNESLGGQFDFEQVLIDSGVDSGFRNNYNTCKSFIVLGDYGSDASSNIYEPTKLYFIFSINDTGVIQARYKSDKTQIQYYTVSAVWYTYDFSTGKVAFTNNSTNTTTTNIKYSLSKYTQFSLDTFYSEQGATYFADKIYVKPLSWNYEIQYWLTNQYWNPQGSVLWTISPEAMNDSDYPWEDGNAGGSGSGDTYYNYDFIGPNPQPYLKSFYKNGNMGSDPTKGYFSIYTWQNVPDKYKKDNLWLNLSVWEVDSSKKVKFVDSYLLNQGTFLDVADIQNFTTSSGDNGTIIYTYDILTSFGTDFLNDYLNSDLSYAFTIDLYDQYQQRLSTLDLLYFGDQNNMNSYEDLDDYFNPPYNNNGYGDINLNTDFSDLVNIFFSFMSTVMGFLSIFPFWMTTLIAMGITVAIILRIGGR